MTETQDVQDDKSLDSFFAKKDKSKKPKKKKTTKSNDTIDTLSEKKTKGQGDDWNDFKEEKEKDYSNLKIQNLQVVEEGYRDEIAEETPENETECDEDGVRKKNIDSTHWSIPVGAQQTTTEIAELPGTQNVIGGKYIPPSVKRSTMMGSMGSTARKSLAAPDIQSKAAFPTLSAANQDLSTLNKSSSDFEVVRRGTRTNDARVEESNRPRLDLGNRYDGLRS